jgi:hypothetical protein
MRDTPLSTLSIWTPEDLAYDRLSIDRLSLDDLRLSDLDAAGWGAAWQPDGCRQWRTWPDSDGWLDQPDPDPPDPAPPDRPVRPDPGGHASRQISGWREWPILARVLHARRVPVTG